MSSLTTQPVSAGDPTHAERPVATGPGGVRRGVFLALGVLCVGLAVAGVILPGVPVTIFLILASYFLTRSSPRLEAKVMDSRLFRPYARYLRGDVAMPRKAKAAALVMMWAMIAASSALLVSRGLGWWAPALVVASGVAGTVMIVRYGGIRRGAGAPA